MPKLNELFWLSDLQDYLLEHESDIAYSSDDFGTLESVFVHYFNREPKQ